MANERKIAVIAGTPVDTGMGVEYLEKKISEAGDAPGLALLYLPAAESCDEQVKFQYSDEDGKRAVIDNIFDQAISEGANDFFIYCNSLSGAFDFDKYALKKSIETGKDIRVYTPLQVYRHLGRSYSRIGVMAANNLSTHSIEEALMSSNPDIYVIGTGNMAIVRAIEDGLDPAEVVDECGLEDMAAYMEASGAEAILLGCTHFPYFREELAELTSLPILDPADAMYEDLLRESVPL